MALRGRPFVCRFIHSGVATEGHSYMESQLASTSPDVQAELTGRHKRASTTVVSFLVATILLSIIAFLGRPYYTPRPNPVLDMAVRLLILFLGLGSVVWRRNKFQPMKLQDIAGLQGPSGLLIILEKTTLQLAMLGIGITIIGFITTLVTGNDLYTYWASAIAVVVLVYSYPTKSSWMRALTRFTSQEPAEGSQPAQ